MKKTSLISISCALALTAALCTPTSAYSGDIKVPYGTPTIDGKLDAAEWSGAAVIALDSTTLSAKGWKGSVPSDFGGSLKILWDDSAVYFAVDIIDSNVTNSDSGFGSGDMAQFSLDPGQVYLKSNPGDDRANFYGIGLYENGGARIVSQTSGAGKDSISDGTDGVAIKTVRTSGGWQIELAVPMSLMKEEVKGKAKTDIELTAGSKIGMLFCYMDHNGGADWINGFGLTGADSWANSGWSPVSHIVLDLQAKAEKPAEPTTAPATADSAALIIAGLAASAAAVVVFKKKK